MELIFYSEASELLGVTTGTLAHAVSRGELTRAGMQGNKQRLIKEQVMLYTGINPRTGNKKRISYEGLTHEEQALWQRYADASHAPTGGQAMPDIERLVREEVIRQEMARREEETRIATINAQLRTEQEERFRKDNHFILARQRDLIPA